MDPLKKQPAPPAAPWQGEALEFEITDFDDARRVLDNESLAQFEVATVASPEQWKRIRRVKVATDRALSGRTIDWLMKLPPSLRPERLCSQFPRIVNALAEVWDEPGECQAELDKLLGDGRKGRQGFPREVQDELIALRDWTQVF